MSLYYFHRVLIASAILFALGFAAYSYQRFGQSGDTVDLATSITSGMICLGMIGYLIYFNAKVRRLQGRAVPGQQQGLR